MPKLSTLASTAALALLAATALTGCSIVGDLLGDPGSAVRDEEGQVVEPGDVDVFSLAIGDCFDDEGTGDQISSVPIVPCSDPHDNEVYHEFEVADGEYPGDEAIAAQADEGCLGAFAGFVALAYDDSVLGYFPLTPTASGWEQGDRLVQCAIYEPDIKVTGTLKNAAR